jgi:diaminobutyrate-2-oxoglutarate transaminase
MPHGNAPTRPHVSICGYSTGTAQSERFRGPALADGAELWRLAGACGTLEVNSPYTYLMLSDHFAETCVIAERDGAAVGFVAAFIVPGRPDTIFVWQVGVAPQGRGRGLGKAMLAALLKRPGCAGIRYLEATVTPSNHASEALFRAFARDRGARCATERGYPEEVFPGDAHETERRFRIGPLSAPGAPRARAEPGLSRQEAHMHQTFERLESNVRSYCRDFAAVFTRAKDHRIWAEDGREFIDFFAGAGGLNYGHNPDDMKEKLLEYIGRDGITHGLDMATSAKESFLERFNDVVLGPRGMTYRVLFPGPTGTNAVEAALKLARKVTGRTGIVSFTNGFHGMTLGALALTANPFKRSGAGVPLGHGTAMPYCGYMGDKLDTLAYLDRMVGDAGSGLDLPAAVIVETLQGEGGLNTASFEWLRGVADICARHEILLIVDDIQAGCGRTGPFFSFEPAGIKPDIICLSKSISGYGLPLAITLVKPEYDRFAPGEHNGTFRGNNPAFVTATAALRHWETPALQRATAAKAETVRQALTRIVASNPGLRGQVRGRGLMQGIAIGVPGLAKDVCAAAFDRGLIMETSGPASEVAKVMPPLTIDDAALTRGLEILADAAQAAVAAHTDTMREAAD